MVKLFIRKKERNQKVLILTVCTMISFSPIVHFVNQLCRLIFGTGFSLDTLLCYAILLGMLLASLKQLHFQIKVDALFLVVLFAVAYLLSYYSNEKLHSYLFTRWDDFVGNPVYLLFAFSIPAYVFMRYITEYDRLFETCRIFSLVVVLCSIGSFILMFLRDRQPEYMSFSYNLLFATIFSLIYFIKRRKVLLLLAAIAGLIMIFLAGARGPLVCVLSSLLVYLLISKAAVAKKTLLVFLLLSIGFVIMLIWEPLLTALKDFADSAGISIRTVDLLIDGEFSSDSGRLQFQQKIIEGFSLLGSGLYGDRLLGEYHYAHNLIIELIAQWGCILGVILVVILCVLLFKGFHTKDTNLQLLVLVFFSSSFVKLMFSGSYLSYNAGFFVLIAACVNAVDVRKAAPAMEASAPQIKKSKYIKAAGRYG